MRTITEEEKVHEDWYKRAKDKEMSLETLPEFLRELTEDYGHDYGTLCHAVAAGALAAARAVDCSSVGGITGFQAGAVMWEFICQWMDGGRLKGRALLDYDDLLFPQYGYKFNSISPGTWRDTQRKAKEFLAESRVVSAHPDVVEHWKSVANGEVPFGLEVNERR